jgi:xylan 1,4-beta-xylosidase
MADVEFTCDLTERLAPLPQVWRHSVGSGHAPLALRADYQSQLGRCRAELGFGYVRFHGLLSDDLGTLISQNDRLLYSFLGADRIIDYLLSIGMRPFVELSFMPEALASGRKTVFRYRANVTPPSDYEAWSELIRRLVSHWVDRYGAEEVREWFLEVWNEPNLKAFWAGSRDQYFRLYRCTADAIKSVDASLRVGGPATAKNAWIEELLDFCEREDVPADFVTTHHYPTDAFGRPDDDTVAQLAESRRSVLREQAQDARRRAGSRPLYYTEWNTSSNPRDPLHDEPYAAAFVVKTVMEASNSVDGYAFWTFSDIFEENYLPSVPFHGGFGLLTLHGVAKPTYRAYQVLRGLGDELMLVDGHHPTLDAWVVRGPDSVAVLTTNHALPRHPIEDQRVSVRISGIARPSEVSMRRIDGTHANAKRAWLDMGAPEYPDDRQLDELHDASRLTEESCSWSFDDGTVLLSFVVPSHGVASVTLLVDRKQAHGAP